MSVTGLLGLSGKTHLEDIADSFAFDLSKRISASQKLNNAKEADALDPENSAAREEKFGQLRRLEQALGGVVNYMAETHGEKAAGVMLGLVYKRLGQDEITEENLGNAFLDVTRFIDANFGFAEGDAFMAELNGSLNAAMNDFFDNGLNERFMAAPAGWDSAAAGVSPEGLRDKLTAEAARYAESVLSMLKEARAGQPEKSNPGIMDYVQSRQSYTLRGVMLNASV
ncbi:MAG: hypothetical protein LBM00_02090 [Deltaproteobacteria bacterium]|jgi:hypothetical protein|nr:hypothetical protein [Deltaproteobacteria bacterium]